MNCGAVDEEGAPARKKTGGHDMHCIHPGDLIPYTRKPMFLIIDSPTASSFKVRLLIPLYRVTFICYNM